MYIVKVRTATGWKEIKRFSNATDAEFWLTHFIRLNGYSNSDFNIIVK